MRLHSLSIVIGIAIRDFLVAPLVLTYFFVIILVTLYMSHENTAYRIYGFAPMESLARFLLGCRFFLLNTYCSAGQRRHDLFYSSYCK